MDWQSRCLSHQRFGVELLRLQTVDNGGFRTAAFHGELPAEQWRVGTLHRPSPHDPITYVGQTRKPVQVADLREHRHYLAREPLTIAAVEGAGIRTLLLAPMLKESELIGAFAIYSSFAGIAD
jgi:hypothetical protein